MQTHAYLGDLVLVGDATVRPVLEIIRTGAGDPPIEERYHPDFLADCVALTTQQASSVHEGDLYNGSGFTRPPEPAAPPAAVGITIKTDVWRRCTDAEAEALEAGLQQASPKLRGLWNDATALHHDAPEFPMLRAAFVDQFGETRADELLASSA